MGHVVSFTYNQTRFLFSDLLMVVLGLSLEGRSKQLLNKLQGTGHGNCHGGMKAWPGIGCPTLADSTTAKQDNQLGSSDSTCLHLWALIAGRAFEKGPLISALQTIKWYIMFQVSWLISFFPLLWEVRSPLQQRSSAVESEQPVWLCWWWWEQEQY